MIYKFIDTKGTFIVKHPSRYNLYFPLTNKAGTFLSSISPQLAGDIKKDNDRFLTVPASIEDLRSNLLCRREFFIKVNGEIIRLSRAYDDILEAGFLYHKIIKNTKTLHIEIINFIPYNLDAEVMWIKIKNKTHKTVKITPTSFIPLYGRGENNLRDHRHVSSLLNRLDLTQYGIILKPTMVFDERKHRENETMYFVLGYEGRAVPPKGQFPTLDYFYGKADACFPDAITKNVPPVKKKYPEFDGKEACGALRFKETKLKRGNQINYFLIMGICENKKKLLFTFQKLNSPLKIQSRLEETKKYWSRYLTSLEFDFKDYNFNNWLLWVKLQPTLRKLFGCSHLPHFDYGKGGRGWRDLWQDVLTLVLTEEKKAKELILHNFKGVRIDGSNATVITKKGAFISDRNRLARVWMDHGMWPYLALKFYIHRTADLGVLLTNTTYFKDHLLKRAKEKVPNFSQKDFSLQGAHNTVYRGTILEHILIQNLVPFFNVGSHNIIRLENADWNDGLDMAPGKGESIPFSFMYAHNLKDLCFFLERLRKRTETVKVLKELLLLLDRLKIPLNYNNFRAKQKRLERYLEETKSISGKKVEIKISDLICDLQQKSEHLSSWLKKKEWLTCGFFNGYYDNRGRRVEGKYRGKIRMMLASSVFPIMGGSLRSQQIRKIWSSVKKYLKDKRRGGFRLNTDFGSLSLDLGRAFGFSYGDKENGAFFNHMVVMFAHALYAQGFVREGRQVLNSLYAMTTSPQAEIYPMIPEYFNNEGKGLYLYLTGSASWYIYTLLKKVLGIEFIFGNMAIEPKLLAADLSHSQIKTTFNFAGKRINVCFLKERSDNKMLKIRKVLLNTQRILPLSKRYMIHREQLKELKEVCIKVFLS
ncbi:MAG: cellobiose phosphorylase [Candidatus Omnitrophota bacterium]|nr:MAG: cellobiose phosphorylase [Candidatus Omnitrophota bacterium]